MKKLSLVFYYTTTGMAFGYLVSMLLFFSVAFEMMIGLDLVMYVFTGLGLVIALIKCNLDWPYLFFGVEIIGILSALFTGKILQYIYITKETLRLNLPASRITPYFLIFAILVNLANIYIVIKQKNQIQLR